MITRMCILQCRQYLDEVGRRKWAHALADRPFNLVELLRRSVRQSALEDHERVDALAFDLVGVPHHGSLDDDRARASQCRFDLGGADAVPAHLDHCACAGDMLHAPLRHMPWPLLPTAGPHHTGARSGPNARRQNGR